MDKVFARNLFVRFQSSHQSLGRTPRIRTILYHKLSRKTQPDFVLVISTRLWTSFAMQIRVISLGARSPALFRDSPYISSNTCHVSFSTYYLLTSWQVKTHTNILYWDIAMLRVTTFQRGRSPAMWTLYYAKLPLRLRLEHSGCLRSRTVSLRSPAFVSDEVMPKFLGKIPAESGNSSRADFVLVLVVLRYFL